jgi:hypothetical protein
MSSGSSIVISSTVGEVRARMRRACRVMASSRTRRAYRPLPNDGPRDVPAKWVRSAPIVGAVVAGGRGVVVDDGDELVGAVVGEPDPP